MPILFSISVLALVALLWASISAAQHIRRARRRKRRGLGLQFVSGQGRLGLQGFEIVPGADEVSFLETEPYRQAAVAKPKPPQPIRLEESRPKVAVNEPEPPYIHMPAYVPKLTFTQVSPFVSAAERSPSVHPAIEPRLDVPPAQMSTTPARHFGLGLFSAARKRSEEAAEAAAPEPHPLPESTAETPRPAAVPLPAPPLITRAPRPVLNRSSAKMERPDWAYFNKDMGDLTDPYESPRSRSRITLGESRR